MSSPLIWKGPNAKMLNAGALEFKNGVSFSTYLTVASAEAATPTGPQLAYVVESCALYLYSDNSPYAADGDIVLATGNGGATRWELQQKLSRSIAETGWVDSTGVIITALNATTARLSTYQLNSIAIKGVRIAVPIGNYDVVISGAAGIKFVYFDDDTLVLKLRDTLWDFDTETPAMIIYWSGTAIVAAPQTELHGLRDNIWHKYTHTFTGLQYNSGLAFTGSVQTDNNVDPGATETVYNLWSTSGVIQDEDIQATPGAGQWLQTLGSNLTAANAGVFNFFFYNSAIVAANASMADRAPFIHAGANTTPQWNNGGILTASVTGDYSVYHYFVTPMVGGWSVFGRPHNAKYTSLAGALAASPSQLIWSNFAELKHIYTAIFRVNTTWANSHRCKLVSLRDFRTAASTPIAATNPTSHSALSAIELAGAGVLNGHISDNTQEIVGAKTFSNGISATINNNSLVSAISVANPSTGTASGVCVELADGADKLKLYLGNTENTTSDIFTLNSSAGMYTEGARDLRFKAPTNRMISFAIGTADAARFHIGSGNARFGIGPGTPATSLHVNIPGFIDTTIKITNGYTGGNSTDGTDIILGTDKSASLWNWEDSHMKFATNNLERIRILSTGQVGIGTATPKSQLHVSGGIQMGDDTAAASSDKAGCLRYVVVANVSRVDMCMKTGAVTWEWVTISPSSYQIRHARYEIINPADDTGTLTLASGVSILEGYEARAAAYIYDTNATVIQIGNPLMKSDTNYSPEPIPYLLSCAPNGAWEIRNPFTNAVEVPSNPFAVIYACKIASNLWSEGAPLTSF